MDSRLAAVLLVATALLPGRVRGLPAQAVPAVPAEPAAEAAIDERIDKAIADYEEVRRDRDKAAQRRRLLAWLGEIDHPRVTEYLQKELKQYGKGGFAPAVLEAIGKVPRPDLEPDIMEVLTQPKAPHEVRVAAAAQLIALGKVACDRVLELAADTDEAKVGVRLAAVEAAAASGDGRAQRALAPLLLEGDDKQRLTMLEHTAAIQGVPAISNSRIKLVHDGNLHVAAMAWKQLMIEEHTRAKALAIDVLERVFETPPPEAAAELILGIVRLRDPDFYPVLLRYGAIRGKPVKQALRDAAGEAAKDRKLLDWLVVNGLDAETPQERTAAKVLLMRAPVEVVQPLVERVRKEMKRSRKRVLETAEGLHELLAKDPTWQQDLATMAAGRDLESRLLGLSMLLEMGSPACVPSAQKYLDHKAWELRSLSIRYLTVCRDVSSIPLLIDRYGKEEGRLAYELDTALFKHTGTRCWKRSDWQHWWKDHGTGFVLPHPESVAAGGTSSGGQTVSYYGIPLVSARVAFLVDHSGSMRAAIGTDKKKTRLDAAKEQLASTVAALPATHEVNLIMFERQARALWRELRPLDQRNREEFLEVSAKIPFGRDTNTFDAIEMAFDDETVDTIYLLTDGQPTSGAITDVDDIIDAVQRMNRTRQIVIHSISIGLDSDLLRELAAMSGGQYVYIR